MAKTSTRAPTRDPPRSIFSWSEVSDLLIRPTGTKGPGPNWKKTGFFFFFCVNLGLTGLTWGKNKKHKRWQKRSSLVWLWRTFLFLEMIPILSLLRFFFYCKSSFDCWKNRVIWAMKTRQEFPERDLDRLTEIFVEGFSFSGLEDVCCCCCGVCRVFSVRRLHFVF